MPTRNFDGFGVVRRGLETARRRRRGFAFALVLVFSVTIFLALAVLYYLTREENYQASRSINTLRASHLAESVHLFLLAQAFGSSWERRFFKEECQFGSEIPPAKEWQKLLDASIRAGFFQSANPDIDYEGRIVPIDLDKNHVIEIEVNVYRRGKFSREMLLRQFFFDRYKRNVLDALGDTGSLFRDETMARGKTKAELDKISDEDKRLLLGSGQAGKDIGKIIAEYLAAKGKGSR